MVESNYNLRAFEWGEKYDTPSPVFSRHTKVREQIELHREGRLGPIGFRTLRSETGDTEDTDNGRDGGSA